MRGKLDNKKKKIKTGVTIDSNVIDIMDEFLKDIGNTTRSKYIEKLIKEDLEIRGYLNE